MSAENTTRKPSANKNIKKLRAISMVCSLTHSWQQWVSDNEEKQACEPSGWAPGCPKDPKDAIKEAAKNRLSQKSLLSQDPTKSKGDGEAPGESLIRTAQVIKTVTRDVQERGAGIEFLTKRICKDPATDELDKMLSKKGSPTCRRKCSNTVSELMQGWKEIEKEKMQAVGDVDNEFPEERDLELGTSQENYQTNEHTESSSFRIKRSTLLGSKKDVEDANKINALSKKYSTVGNLKNRWQNWASEHSVNQKLNPFSDDFDYEYSMSTRLQKGEEGYGRPKEGSKTAERAKRAEAHIHREIDDMCFVIRTMADQNRDGRTRVTFGELFDRYVRISDKVVGILMRARKHGKLEFEGEMLWQGRDDNVIITLLV